jgi:hypothetical protein
MSLNLGTLNGMRIVDPGTVQYLTPNYSGDRIGERFGMPTHHGLGSTALRSTLGHGGVGTSYS